MKKLLAILIFIGFVGFAAFSTVMAGTGDECREMGFADFSDTSLLALNGSAQVLATTDGNVLRLTPAQMGQSGSAFSQEELRADYFSTFFSFRITEPGGSIFDCNTEAGADGLVFVVQAVSSDIGGSGGGIGYYGISPSVGVEFDTWCNGAHQDPGSNHIGIDVNGSVDHGSDAEFTREIGEKFDDGGKWYAWVDYDGTVLQVRVSRTPVRPENALLERELDIPAILGQDHAYIGFTSGTGSDWGNHDILEWTYMDCWEPVVIECSSSHPGACTDESSCVGADGFWYDNACHSIPGSSGGLIANCSSAAPPAALPLVNFPATILNPMDNPVVVGARSEVTVQPTMQIPTADIGQTAQLIMYIYLPDLGFGINIPSKTVTLSAETLCDLLPNPIDLSTAAGFSFYVYYGYVIGADIKYAAYAVTVDPNCVDDCGSITDAAVCSATPGCIYQTFPASQCVADCGAYHSQAECESAFGGDTCKWSDIFKTCGLK